MLFVVSYPQNISREAETINLLFENGMELFHLRKPGWHEKEIDVLLEQISKTYHHRIVFHQAHELAKRYGSTRLHFKEAERHKINDKPANGLVLSTSIHSLDVLDTLPPFFEYAFTGPVFDSISKRNYSAVGFDERLLKKKRKIKLIAIGGVKQNNIGDVLQRGFDGAAVLGHVWQSVDPVETFIRLRKKYEQCAATC